MYAAENRPKYGKATHLTGSFEDAKRYQKWTFIGCYYRKHIIYPGVCRVKDIERSWTIKYPHIDPHEVPFRQVHLIDMSGCFLYQSYGTDILHAVKDKAICPTNIHLVENAQDLSIIPSEEKNQLLDVLTWQNLIDTDDTLFYNVKLEDKPEAKKPMGE